MSGGRRKNPSGKKILDSTPLLNSDLIELSRWVSSYYLCSWGEAL
ncbi:MAG: hypothetical protein IKS30_04715, partial [Treponema sp.]|nr:hypothetical protein [Treponema sp.]